MGRPKTPGADRFWPKVSRAGDAACWLWQASTCNGYGQFRDDNSRMVKAHTYAYRLLVGEPPAGTHPDHLCKTPACVNPRHLEWVAPATNNARSDSPSSLNAKKTVCKRGHPFDWIDPKRGWRQCLTCVRQADAARKRRYHREKHGRH